MTRSLLVPFGVRYVSCGSLYVPMPTSWRGASNACNARALQEQARWAQGRLHCPFLTTLWALHWASWREHLKPVQVQQGMSRTPTAGKQQRVPCFLCLQPGSELDNLEEILDDLQNSQLPQLFPDSRPGAPAGSVDKQAIINDLMQLTSDGSPGAAVATQKPAMRISQSSESGLRACRKSLWSPKTGVVVSVPPLSRQARNQGSFSAFP